VGRLCLAGLLHPGASEAPTDLFKRWVRKTGETIWVRTTEAPLGKGQGRVITAEDVSAWYADYSALRKAEEIYRVAAQHSSCAIFKWDTRTDRISFHGLGRLGLEEPELSATFSEWSRRINPADLESLQRAIGRHYETREPVIVRFRIALADGSESLIEVRGSAFWNTSGDCSTWIGVMKDISEQQESEEALSQLAAIVHSCDDAIVGCDLDCRIISWNNGAERLYGYTAEEVMGRPLSLLVPERPERTIAEAGLGEAAQGVRRMESIHLTKDGSCPVSLSLSPVLRKDGRLTGFSLISHDISERRRTERRLIHQALHDALTGLPNRRLLREHLEMALLAQSETGRQVGVFFVDIDGFKTINDTLGHVIGDQLLRSIADRLNCCARKTDMLSRAGGDEFVLTVTGLQNRHSARLVTTRLIDCLRQPFPIAGNEIFVCASIGVSLFPDDCDDADSLLRNSDAAMYQAKRRGKNQVCFFSAALSDRLRERLEIANSLRAAIERSELGLHFQPVVDISGTRVLRFEALLRWRPQGGEELPPSAFIPIIEETGQIVQIGKWVLTEACRTAQSWQVGEHGGVGVCVNVSAVQLAREDFVPLLREILAETGLDPRLLELELTESIFVNDPRATARIISDVHALGVTMALDDFGTGYSSLGYLRNLPMDALKIDKGFVAGIGTDPAAVVLIESLVSLAHCLGMRVVVEGVETCEQHRLLQNLGCDELQGYLFGKPTAEPAAPLQRPPAVALPLPVAPQSLAC
ncbi:MAG TPA: EAL domain-containing protein, partial [Bryobacteraceae bacterium]|nr:EAL domain-containing protein [Bryobacteraceae bacterium]